MVSDDNETNPKKRTRLFKPRTARKGQGDTQSAVTEPVEADAPETATPEVEAPTVEAEAPAADVEAEPDAPVEAEPEPEAEASEPETALTPFPVLKPVSTTSLLFYAPPVEYLAPRPGTGPVRERDDDDEPEEGSSTSRRRSRARRGRGGASVDGDQASAEREDRPERSDRYDRSERTDRVERRDRRERRPAELITEPQRIKGSTRLEAKKQRRRDGRDAGRRRAVITEAEFLARRESVDRTMVVRSKDGRIQIGVLEDGVLVEHYVARSQESSIIGNVYLGRVQNVLPSMEAAFIDIGKGRNAVLYAGEVNWDCLLYTSDAADE